MENLGDSDVRRRTIKQQKNCGITELGSKFKCPGRIMVRIWGDSHCCY